MHRSDIAETRHAFTNINSHQLCVSALRDMALQMVLVSDYCALWAVANEWVIGSKNLTATDTETSSISQNLNFLRVDLS